MKTKDLLILAVIIGAIWYYTSGQTMPPPRNLSAAQKRSALVKWVKLSTDSQATKDRVTDLVANQMTDGEISTVYTFISEYFNKGQTVPEGSELQKQIAEISAKYDVFT